MKAGSCFLFFFICLSTNVKAQWELTNGPYTAGIAYLAENSFTKSVFASTSSAGLYRCKSGSSKWEDLSDRIPLMGIGQVVTDNSTIYIRKGHGFTKSADDGETWEDVVIDSAFASPTVLYCKNNFILIADNKCKLYISSNSGISFSLTTGQLNIYMSSVDDIMMKGNRIIIVGWYNGNYKVYYSDDFGASWIYTKTILKYGFSSDVVLRLFYNDVYLVDSDSIYQSTDDGSTWKTINTIGVYQPWFTDLFISHDTILIGTMFSGLFLSDDDGANYSEMDLGLLPIRPVIYRLLSTNEKGILVASNLGVFSSTDMGITWNRMNEGLSVIAPSCMKNYKNELFLGTLYQGLYSTKDGLNWTTKSNGLEYMHYYHSAFDFSSVGDRLVIGSDEDIYYSDDQGYSWLHRNIGNSIAVSDLKNGNGKLIAGTSDGLYYSTDSAYTWTLFENVPAVYISGLEVKDNTILVSEYDPIKGISDVLRSDDNGISFHVVVDNNSYYDISMIDTVVLAISAWDQSLVRSTDQGKTWIKDSTFNSSRINCIKVINSYDYCLGTTDGKIFYSDDHAKTWTDITGNFKGNLTSACALGNYLYVASLFGVWCKILSSVSESGVNPFIIYPNPVSNELILKNPKLLTGFGVKIFNIQGQLMAEKTLSGPSTKIDFTGFAIGAYLIKIESNYKSFVSKIIKK